MGFLRKSVKVGPLRFNLSKSGVSVSTGIPGLRLGVGPRGNWIRMGSGGLSYRAALSRPAKLKPLPRYSDGQRELKICASCGSELRKKTSKEAVKNIK